MAFTSIAWKGIGVIADCDALADNQGGTWAELGGGGISANTDNPLVPPASIGHVYASKSGYGYYTTPATYDFTGGGNAEGQYIYIMIQIQSASAFDTFANNGFAFVVGTDTNNHRYFQLASSDIGGGKTFDGGGWKLFVIDPTITGSIADKGTFNPATINMVGLWMDTIVNVRADTIFIGSVAIGSGVQVTGTGTLEELVDYCTDYTTRAWPVLRKEGRSYFAYGSVTAGDNANATINTLFTDSGKSLEFRFTEFWDGTAWALSHPVTYNSVDLEKHASYTTDYTSNNTALLSNAEAKLSMSVEAGATQSLIGGSLDIMSSFVTYATEVTDTKILNSVDSSTINNTPINCTWNVSGLITVNSGATLDACKIKLSTSTISTNVLNLNQLTDVEYFSDGSNHAVDLGTISTTQTMNWNNYLTDYAAADGATGNEAILVSVDSGIILTVSVGAGYSTPYIYNTGLGTVIVVSGQATYTQTMVDQITLLPIEGVAVTIKPTDATGPWPFEESVTITSTGGTATVAHTAHGFSIGHKVEINGANENEYNRIKTILTVPTADSYTYAIAGTPASPATGTIISTAIIIDGLTDSNGEIADTRGYGGTDQLITGTGKKGSSNPVYKSAPITGTINNASGADITTLMTAD